VPHTIRHLVVVTNASCTPSGSVALSPTLRQPLSMLQEPGNETSITEHATRPLDEMDRPLSPSTFRDIVGHEPPVSSWCQSHSTTTVQQNSPFEQCMLPPLPMLPPGLEPPSTKPLNRLPASERSRLGRLCHEALVNGHAKSVQDFINTHELEIPRRSLARYVARVRDEPSLKHRRQRPSQHPQPRSVSVSHEESA
jgi:hypothetical protein